MMYLPIIFRVLSQYIRIRKIYLLQYQYTTKNEVPHLIFLFLLEYYIKKTMKKLFDQAAFCVDDTLDAGSSGSVLNSLGMPVNPATTEALRECFGGSC